MTWVTEESAVCSKGVQVHCCNKNLTCSAFPGAITTSVTVQLSASLCFCNALAIGIVLSLSRCAKRSLQSWEPECCSSNAGHFRTVCVYPPAVLLMHINLHYRVVVHWCLHIHHYTVLQTHMHVFVEEPITNCVSYRCLYCAPLFLSCLISVQVHRYNKNLMCSVSQWTHPHFCYSTTVCAALVLQLSCSCSLTTICIVC